MSVGKYLPIGSFAHYFDKGFDEDFDKKFGPIRSYSKLFLHFVYAVVPAIALISYIGGGIQTGEWDLRTQIRVNIQRNNERYAEMKKKRNLMEKIFEENGLADINKDGKISLNELDDAYTRLGLEDDVLKSRSFNFQKRPSLEQLEKAVESYAEK